MSRIDERQKWTTYCTEELKALTPILHTLGYTIDDVQPHLGGERYLQQAITTTSGRKLILFAHDKDQKRVVIKATSDAGGIQELNHERTCRRVLEKINFAYDVFISPKELTFVRKDAYVISVQEFIEQKCAFTERPLQEQFALALRAFKAQESAHATTHRHYKRIEHMFGSYDATAYIHAFQTFIQNIETASRDTQRSSLLEAASAELQQHKEIIEQYCGFLTHTDFVPHNIRVVGTDIYLLDHSSLRFGNKYEGWARFINFMTLYNPKLQEILEEYVSNNRTAEEQTSLRLMRMYRLGEIIWYYVGTLQKSDGNLQKLNTERIHFWTEVLSSVINKTPLSEHIIASYKRKRDALRSDEEKKRQVGLH